MSSSHREKVEHRIGHVRKKGARKRANQQLKSWTRGGTRTTSRRAGKIQRNPKRHPQGDTR